MPTTYAHWRFGDHAYQTLNNDLQDIIIRYRDLFDIGVHGPDVFFYYNCLLKDNFYSYGSYLHHQSMRKLLDEQFKPAYKNSDNKEATLAYLLGFLAHFTFDSLAHSFIECKAQLEGPSHNKIESQYDRHLLELDGYDPVKKSVTFSLRPTRFGAHIIAGCFPHFDDDLMYKVIKAQPFYLNLLKDKTDAKRLFLTTVMNALHVQSFIDLMTTTVNEPSCEASNMRIDKYFDIGVSIYRTLAYNMYDYLVNDTPLHEYFDNHFEQKEDFKSLPLLSAEQEKDYVVDLKL